MSADNWRVCPRCEILADEEQRLAEEGLGDLYGKIQPEEYVREFNKVKFSKETDKESLREDYEIGLDEDGEFYVIYHCGCSECGFEFEYKHTEKVEVMK